jgi:hypothetical protein
MLPRARMPGFGMRVDFATNFIAQSIVLCYCFNSIEESSG